VKFTDVSEKPFIFIPKYFSMKMKAASSFEKSVSFYRNVLSNTPFGTGHFMLPERGHFTNTCKVLKCGAGEGWGRLYGPIV
jgi:hypothetical protein